MHSKVKLRADAWAIKIGGSLYNSKFLVPWLMAINERINNNIVIIPGGGPFADQVRSADEKFKLGENAHLMAVMAMQQYAVVLASLCEDLVQADTIENIQEAWNDSKVAIWQPYEMVRNQCELDASWDISSDSLAIWLANKLKINNVLLVKSTDEVKRIVNLETLTQHNCIDPGLIELADKYHVNLHFSHKSESNNLHKYMHVE